VDTPPWFHFQPLRPVLAIGATHRIFVLWRRRWLLTLCSSLVVRWPTLQQKLLTLLRPPRARALHTGAAQDSERSGPGPQSPVSDRCGRELPVGQQRPKHATVPCSRQGPYRDQCVAPFGIRYSVLAATSATFSSVTVRGPSEQGSGLDAPCKQRHTAKRILDRLVAEHGADLTALATSPRQTPILLSRPAGRLGCSDRRQPSTPRPA
jgi:hypothetical protein